MEWSGFLNLWIMSRDTNTPACTQWQCTVCVQLRKGSVYRCVHTWAQLLQATSGQNFTDTLPSEAPPIIPCLLLHSQPAQLQLHAYSYWCPSSGSATLHVTVDCGQILVLQVNSLDSLKVTWYWFCPFVQVST